MNTQTRFAALLIAFVIAPLLARAVDAPVAQDAADAPDLLRDAIDPHNLARERGRFIRAAGVDSELDEAEAKPRDEGDGFIRIYDKWPAIKPFDRDKNGLIDWAEAASYRAALRKAVFAKYDADNNSRLEGEERNAASRDLAEGKVQSLTGPATASTAPAPTPTPGAPPQNNPFVFGQPGQPGQLPPQLMAALDTDKDGQLSKGERINGMRSFRDRGWQWALTQFDKDGDGKLSDGERLAAPPPIRFAMKLDALGLRDFDEDRDGQLSDAEYSALDDYFQKLMAVNQQNMLRLADTDGDGQLSAAEQAAIGTKMQAVMFQVLPRAMSWADSNGDGQASPEEWMGLVDNFSNGFDRQIARYTKQFDADGDGRLSAPERDALIAGSQEEEAERYRRHDLDGDGQLNVQEMLASIEEAAEEWGVKPAK